MLKFNLLNSILPDVFRNELSRKQKSVLLKLGHYSAEDLKKKKDMENKWSILHKHVVLRTGVVGIR